MKKNLFFLFLVAFSFISNQAIAQTTQKKITQPVVYSDNVNAPLTAKELFFLTEIYQDKLEEYVLDRPSRVQAFKHLLRNRIVIKQLNKTPDSSKYIDLSDVPLFNNYNSALSRDTSYNKDTFNVLKYDLPFFSTGGSMYKISNTNYFLIIKSQTYKK